MSILFSEQKGPYIVIIDVGNNCRKLVDVTTQEGAISVAISQTALGKKVVGIAKVMKTKVSVEGPYNNDDQVYFVAEKGGAVQEFAPWGDDPALMDLFLKYLARPDFSVRLVNGRMLRRLVGE